MLDEKQTALVQFLDESSDPIANLFNNKINNDYQLLYNTINMILRDNLSYETLQYYELLDTYTKIQNLNDFTYIEALLEPYDKHPIKTPLPNHLIDQIILYLNIVNVNTKYSYFNEEASTNKYIAKMKYHLAITENERKFQETLFVDEPGSIYESIIAFPEYYNNKTDAIAKIFNLCPEYVVLPKADFGYSKLLEISILNALVKLGYNLNTLPLTYYSNGLAHENKLHTLIIYFIDCLSTNKPKDQIRNSIKMIFDFLNADIISNNDDVTVETENSIYVNFIKFIHTASADFNNLDLAIKLYIGDKINASASFDQLLLEHVDETLCQQELGTNLLQFHKNIHTNNDNNNNNNNNNNIIQCKPDYLNFLRVFKFINYKIINYNRNIDSIEFWPTENIQKRDIPKETIEKFIKLKNYIDFTKPFEYFEALIICSDITTDESDNLLNYVFSFDSYLCTLMAAALHYYTIGTIEFDLRQMFNYVATFSNIEELNKKASYVCQKNLSKPQMVSLEYIYGNIQMAKLSHTNVDYAMENIDTLLQSIQKVAINGEHLQIISSYYDIPEIYLINYIQNKQSNLSHFDNIILCTILFHMNVSTYEKYLLQDIINHELSNIPPIYNPISNEQLLSLFIKNDIYQLPQMSSSVHTCDYKLLVKNKNKIHNWEQLFQQIIDSHQ